MRIEREIFKWKYIFDETGFDIIPNEKMDKPVILYKLYGLNQYSFDSLINQYIYATHPSQLNDIFDCNEELLDFDSIDVIKQFLSDFMSKSEITKLINEDFENAKIKVQRNFRELIYRKLGIFSMTLNPHNVLMWSYYSNHNGFCIEFDISKFPFKYFGPFPINYQPEIEALSISQIGVQLGVLAQSNIKDQIWEHEKEWRLLISAPIGNDMLSPNFEILKRLGGHNRKFYYPIEAIKSVLLGNRFFEPDEIHEIDNMTLEINIVSNFEQKSIMLDFLATNNIKTHIGLRKGFTQLKFRTSSVERISKVKFLLTETHN